MQHEVVISLSLWALQKYTLFRLGLGLAAYAISLIFTLVYGTIAAHNHTAEKVMLPALDILQSIPVLGFLPGVVLAMINLFPNREFGLELSCVLMIFTSQAWNMTFSFHGSVRSIPSALREVAEIQSLSGWQVFRLLEVPAAMIGLVWNSMMSMAGGWFFLSVCEAYQLRIHGVDHDFRLPGIGSYMSEAVDKSNHVAQIGAIIMMTVMIVCVDQIFWRPIVVWSQRFKMEDSSAGDAPRSWIVNLFRRSWILSIASKWIGRRRDKSAAAAIGISTALRTPQRPSRRLLRKAITVLVLVFLGGMALWGAADLLRLLLWLPIRDPVPRNSWMQREDWITVLCALMASFARTTAAVLIGAAWTLPVGILIGLSPKWSHRLQPVTQVLASFPAPMLFPLVYFLLVLLHIPFGVGCVTLMLLGAQWYILFNVVAGASSIPSELKEGCAIFGMSRAQRWKKLYLPSVFPSLVTGLITAAGGAWNATIVAEALKVGGNTIYTFGLGSMMSRTYDNEKYSLLAAAVVTMSIFVVLLNRVVWKRLYRLAESRYSLNV